MPKLTIDTDKINKETIQPAPKRENDSPKFAQRWVDKVPNQLADKSFQEQVVAKRIMGSVTCTIL